ncbi:Hypothetical_protein [Hexamita inflata]|uniref:Hypothetical_protein n=1 Tax=Hexamita inflata TaxID=28002 RepID=A0AA86PNU6_9EUKA|nr:Hypothetical protein HINF_LOCUS29636 [Hexamita inflata]
MDLKPQTKNRHQMNSQTLIYKPALYLNSWTQTLYKKLQIKNTTTLKLKMIDSLNQKQVPTSIDTKLKTGMGQPQTTGHQIGYKRYIRSLNYKHGVTHFEIYCRQNIINLPPVQVKLHLNKNSKIFKVLYQQLTLFPLHPQTRGNNFTLQCKITKTLNQQQTNSMSVKHGFIYRKVVRFYPALTVHGSSNIVNTHTLYCETL